jgi:Nucleotidyltransferase of unknown function (DUF6036)
VQQLDSFFSELDRAWSPPALKPIPLHILGATALMLQTPYERVTKDADVLQLLHIDDQVATKLGILAGPRTTFHTRHGMYLDSVGSGIPFLPQVPRWHPLDVRLLSFELHVLDVVDVAVSKLKRFSANDRADIDAMAKLDLLPPRLFVERFRSAFDVFQADARAADLPRYVEHLNRVERDMLGVDETAFDLDMLHY